jgi:type I restriction enzyme, S subunit
MKNGWQSTTLGDLCGLTSGGTPSKKNPRFWVGDVPFVSARDLKSDRIETALLHISSEAVDQSATKLAPVGSLLMLVRGMGLANGIQIGEVTAPVAFNQDIRALHPPLDSVLPRFLLLALRNSFMNGDGERVVSSAAHGTLKIDTNVLRQIAISLPPLPEQRRLVGILDEAFDGIATAEANAEKNLQNARALFESYLQAVFAHRGVGWVETTLDQISTNLDSKRVPITKSDRTSGDYPYYGASGIVDYVADYIFDGDTLLVSEDGANLLMRSTPIAFSVTGKYWVNNHAHILKFENMATQRFVEFYLGSIRLDEYITGAAQPKLNQKALNSIPIPIPKSIDAQTKIVQTIEGLAEETQRLGSIYQRKLVALDELKKSLLHQAFSGHL